jgi:hypothetical protein
MLEDVTVAAPPAEPIEVEEMHADSPEYQNYLKTGEVPAKPQPGESATPKPGDATQKGADAKSAESGTAKPPKEKPSQSQNWRQLEADRNRERERAEKAEARLKELEAKAAPKTETSAKPLDSLPPITGLPEAPAKPKRADFADDAAYEKAFEEDYLPKKVAFDAATKTFEKQMAQAKERHDQLAIKWKGIKDKGVELYGEEKWKEAANSYDAFNVYGGDPVEVYMRESTPEIAAHFLQYLSLKPADMKRIVSLPPGEQWKELWAIETAMREELKLDAGKEKPPKSEEPKPKAKVVSDALPPPKEVGGQASVSEDEEQAALRKAKDGDPGPYMALTNKRELEKIRSRRR